MKPNGGQDAGFKGYLGGCGGCIFSGVVGVVKGLVIRVLAVGVLVGTVYVSGSIGHVWSGPYPALIAGAVFIAGVVLAYTLKGRGGRVSRAAFFSSRAGSADAGRMSRSR